MPRGRPRKVAAQAVKMPAEVASPASAEEKASECECKDADCQCK